MIPLTASFVGAPLALLRKRPTYGTWAHLSPQDSWSWPRGGPIPQHSGPKGHWGHPAKDEALGFWSMTMGVWHHWASQGHRLTLALSGGGFLYKASENGVLEGSAKVAALLSRDEELCLEMYNHPEEDLMSLLQATVVVESSISMNNVTSLRFFDSKHTPIYVCMYVCMYVCVYIYMCADELRKGMRRPVDSR